MKCAIVLIFSHAIAAAGKRTGTKDESEVAANIQRLDNSRSKILVFCLYCDCVGIN